MYVSLISVQKQRALKSKALQKCTTTSECGYRNFENRCQAEPKKFHKSGLPVNYPKYFIRKISYFNEQKRALIEA